MLALVGGMVADIVIGYAEGEVFSKITGFAKDKIGDVRLSRYILDKTEAAANKVPISDETRAIFDKNYPGFNEFENVRKRFACSIMKSWGNDDIDDYVTKPPCKEGAIARVAEDLRRLIRSIKESLLEDPKFEELMGSERYQVVICAEIKALKDRFDEQERKLNEIGIKIERLSEDLEKLNRPPKLSECILPTTRNFIGRENELREIDDAFDKSNIVFVAGLGGIGKSELCREYATRAKKLRGCKLAWLTFSKTIRKTIVSDLRFSNLDTSESDNEDKIFEKNVEALSREDDVLMILDNYDGDGDFSDLEILSCRILVTTRTSDVPFELVEVGTLPPDQAFELLRRSVNKKLTDWVDANHEGLERAIKQIDGLPVMIPLRAALISIRRPDPSVLADDIFGFKDKVNVTMNGKSEKSDMIGHFRNLMSGFNLSDSEKNVLKVMSILPPGGMERDSLESMSGLESDDITRLSDLYIMSMDPSDEGLIMSMHPLVAEFVKIDDPPSFDEGDPRRRFLDGFLKVLADKSRSARPADMISYAAAVSSIASCLDDDRYPDIVDEACFRFSRCLSDLGLHGEALDLELRSLGAAKSRLPEDDPHIAESYDSAGEEYRELGEYMKALEFHKAALEIRERTLPEDDPEIATSYNNVGHEYGKLGNHEKALELKLKALEMRLRSLPEDDPLIAESYSNVGYEYRKLGNHEKALEVRLIALDIRERTLPENHPDIAESYSNVGCEYGELGDHEKALKLRMRAMDMREKSLPENHPLIATTYYNIGCEYSDMGDHGKALEYQEKALEMRKRTLREGHPHLALSYEKTCFELLNLKRYDDALAYGCKASEIWRMQHPVDRDGVARARCLRGLAFLGLGRSQEAAGIVSDPDSGEPSILDGFRSGMAEAGLSSKRMTRGAGGAMSEKEVLDMISETLSRSKHHDKGLETIVEGFRSRPGNPRSGRKASSNTRGARQDVWALACPDEAGLGSPSSSSSIGNASFRIT